jgi:hypothetical protein
LFASFTLSQHLLFKSRIAARRHGQTNFHHRLRSYSAYSVNSLSNQVLVAQKMLLVIRETELMELRAVAKADVTSFAVTVTVVVDVKVAKSAFST